MSSEKEHLIVKKTLHAGSKSVSFKDGTKVHFHFQTRLCNLKKTLIDDSRKMRKGQPLELILGKKFKLEVWEAIIKKMALNEVAVFTVDKSLVQQYPFVSKTLRDIDVPLEKRRNTHCCAMTLQSEGVGYQDLNEMLKNPTNLEFTLELLKVDQPDSYEKEIWQLNEDEKLKLVPTLKEQGNEEFKQQNYDSAADNYAKAIGIIEQLLIKEKPHSDEWNALEKLKVPLLLNFSQCKLIQGDFYAVIEHCTSVLKTEPNNVKAYFRRAKAHFQVWNTKEATDDFHKAMELDPTLTTIVKKELADLEEKIREKDQDDKKKFQKFFK